MTVRGPLCLCFAGALAALLAAAPSTAAEQSDLDRAIRAYDEGELEKAEKLVRSALLTLYEKRQQARAWLYLGLVRAARQDVAGARAAFAKALGFDSGIGPDRDRIPPSVVKEFDAVRESLRGELVLEANEPRAQVFVDGAARGRTPLTLRLPIGPHRIRLLSEDRFRAHESEVVLTAKGAVRVPALLTPRPGKVRLETLPRDVEIYEGERRLARGPDGALPLLAGRHTLTLRASGHLDSSQEIVVDADAVRSYEVALPLAPRSWYARRRPWGWVSFGVAGASLVTAVVLGKSAQSSNEAITSGQANSTLDYDRLRVLSAGARSDARLANVFFGVAGAAGITGAVLMLLGDSERPRPSAWRVLPGPGGVAVAREF